MEIIGKPINRKSWHTLSKKHHSMFKKKRKPCIYNFTEQLMGKRDMPRNMKPYVT